MAIANFSYVDRLISKENMIDITSRYVLMLFCGFDLSTDNKLSMNFNDNKNEISKITINESNIPWLAWALRRKK